MWRPMKLGASRETPIEREVGVRDFTIQYIRLDGQRDCYQPHPMNL